MGSICGTWWYTNTDVFSRSKSLWYMGIWVDRRQHTHSWCNRQCWCMLDHLVELFVQRFYANGELSRLLCVRSQHAGCMWLPLLHRVKDVTNRFACHLVATFPSLFYVHYQLVSIARARSVWKMWKIKERQEIESIIQSFNGVDEGQVHWIEWWWTISKWLHSILWLCKVSYSLQSVCHVEDATTTVSTFLKGQSSGSI